MYKTCNTQSKKTSLSVNNVIYVVIIYIFFQYTCFIFVLVGTRQVRRPVRQYLPSWRAFRRCNLNDDHLCKCCASARSATGIIATVDGGVDTTLGRRPDDFDEPEFPWNRADSLPRVPTIVLGISGNDVYTLSLLWQRRLTGYFLPRAASFDLDHRMFFYFFLSTRLCR